MVDIIDTSAINLNSGLNRSERNKISKKEEEKEEIFF